MTDFLRLFRFNPKLALGALGSVAAIRLGLSLVRYPTLDRALGNRPGDRPALDDRALRRRVAGAVRVASRLVPGATCLTQAFATKLLLNLRGEDARLCLGAARTPRGAFAAHAWLEKDGEIVIGALPDLSGYKPFTGETLRT